MIFIVLFIFFITTILLSIVLEKLFDSPLLVAITFLSIYLIIVTILFVTGVISDKFLHPPKKDDSFFAFDITHFSKGLP